jgi:uncharacterized protein with von Willebrand factor type A (vWA) domain
MFFSFVDELRAAGIQASLKEHLILLEALDAAVIASRPEDFYYLARATFVKDESLLDRFDQVFGKIFKGWRRATEPRRLPFRKNGCARSRNCTSRPSRWRRSRRSAPGTRSWRP